MFGKRFLYRHPERSRGIFLAHWYSAVCVIAEKGKPSAKEARKSGVQGRFLAALEMTVWGNGFISRSVQRICLESAIPVSSSRAKPSIFPAHRYSVLCETAEKGKPFAKEARKSRVQGRFLAALEMTVWGIEKSKKSRMAASGFICFFIPRLRKPILR